MTTRAPIGFRQKLARFLLGVIVLAGLIVWIELKGDGPGTQQSAERIKTAAVSREVERPSQRYVQGRVGVTLTEADMDRFNKLSVAGDEMGLEQMALSGRLIVIPRRTACTVIDLGFSTSEVRLTEGPYSGQAVFVASHLIEGL